MIIITIIWIFNECSMDLHFHNVKKELFVVELRLRQRGSKYITETFVQRKKKVISSVRIELAKCVSILLPCRVSSRFFEIP